MLNNYYYSELNYAEQAAYSIMRNAILRRLPSCEVQLVNGESLNRVWKAVVLENPEAIHYAGLVFSPRITVDRALCRFDYLRTVTEESSCGINEQLFNEKLNSLIDEIEKKLSPNASDYEVCKSIYDILASSITYDYDVLREYQRIRNEHGDLTAFVQEKCTPFTAYGTLINKVGVCQGISKLFNILCDRFDIPCLCIEAVMNDENQTEHMLNVVELDGDRVFVDVTNGLAVEIDEKKIVRYDYFAVSSQTLNKAITVNREFDCNTDDHNYFVKNKTRFVSLNSLIKYLCAYSVSKTNGEVRCHYAGNGADDDKLEKIMDEVLSQHCAK